MKFSDAVADVIGDLASDSSTADLAVSRGLSLAVAAWMSLADIDPHGCWDLFGLDVCAAVEAVHLALSPHPPIDWAGADSRSTRHTAALLVEGIADCLEAGIGGHRFLAQLESHAAAAQLRRAGGVLR